MKLTIAFLFILIITGVTALEIQVGNEETTNERIVNMPLPLPEDFNNVTGGVNSSEYAEIWITNVGNLDNPLAAWLSTFNATYDSWAYNQTTEAILIADGKFLNLSGTNANQNINISPYDLEVANLVSLDNVTAYGLIKTTLNDSDTGGLEIDGGTNPYTGGNNYNGILNSRTATGLYPVGIGATINGFKNVLTISKIATASELRLVANTGFDSTMTISGAHDTSSVVQETNTGFKNTFLRTGTITANSMSLINRPVWSQVNDAVIYNNVGGSIVITNIAQEVALTSVQGGHTGTVNKANYGEKITVIGSGTNQVSTNYGVSLDVRGADTNWGIYNSWVGTDNLLGKDNTFQYRGSGNDAYDFYNSTDWVFNPKSTGSGKMIVLGDLAVLNNFTGNQIIGGMTFHNDSSSGVTTVITTQNVWVNISGFNQTGGSEQRLNGFTYDNANEELIAQVSGLYDTEISISTGNTGNNQEYQFSVSVNGVTKEFIDVHRKIGAAGDVGNGGDTWWIDVAIGDIIKMIARNNDGTADLNVHKATLKLTRIGN